MRSGHVRDFLLFSPFIKTHAACSYRRRIFQLCQVAGVRRCLGALRLQPQTAALPGGVCFEVVPGITSQRGCKSQPLASLVRKGSFGMHQINSETPESRNHTLTREPRKQSRTLGEEYHLSKVNIIHIERL